MNRREFAKRIAFGLAGSQLVLTEMSHRGGPVKATLKVWMPGPRDDDGKRVYYAYWSPEDIASSTARARKEYMEYLENWYQQEFEQARLEGSHFLRLHLDSLGYEPTDEMKAEMVSQNDLPGFYRSRRVEVTCHAERQPFWKPTKAWLAFKRHDGKFYDSLA